MTGQDNAQNNGQPQESKGKILVIDDDLVLREFYQELLTRDGYTVITAEKGTEGLIMAQQQKPNVILLDIMMPEMDGNEVLYKLKSDPQTEKIPVIMLTNAGNIDNMRTAKLNSAFSFFIKANVEPEEILRTVAEAVYFSRSNQ